MVLHEMSLREDQRLDEDFWFMEPGSRHITPEEAPWPNEPDDPDELVGAGFTLAPRETEDDATNNRKSLNRALKGRVFLLVKNSAPDAKFPWFFPVGEKLADEKMRDAAVRHVAAHVGDDLEVTPVGFAPIGYVKYLHEDAADDSGFDGTKVFFYKSQLRFGDVQLNRAKADDYLWVTRAELAEYLDSDIAEYSPKMQRRPAAVAVATSTPTTTTRPPCVATAPPATNSRFVGAHVSASGGADRAIAASLALDCSARSAAFFVRPRLSWRPLPPLSEAKVAQFRAALASGGQQMIRLEHVAVHGSYLINLGAHDPQLREKSVALMVEEVAKCAQLGVRLYVFHPGVCTGAARDSTTRRAPPTIRRTEADTPRSSVSPSDTGASRPRGRKRKPRADERHGAEREADDAQRSEALRRQSLAFVAEGVAKVLSRTEKTTLVVETMSGQGNVLGSSFEELRSILTGAARLSEAPDARDRLGVCLDTCHVFASGWALESEEQCEAMMRAFHACMGPEWPHALKVVHVNDSRGACGSRTDRHANIGRGEVGMAAFRWLMNSPHFAHLPLILETPRAKKPKRANVAATMKADEEQEPPSEKTCAPRTRRRARHSAGGSALGAPSASEEIELLYSLVEGPDKSDS
ncbi:hypothetical protein PybrP1_003596 [[Pythium] brassicae (nom. inval.)]|nr:hypothetical protein PybrP1_003596 [[Pythium] brassicae (nom. inval.)]